MTRETITLNHRKEGEIMRKNIKNISNTIQLISILSNFIPNPYAKAFLTAANVAVTAEDLRWAGLNGKRVRFEEYCKPPHTSYSHYFRYTILS